MTELVRTWSSDASQEDGMTDEHTWIWKEMINAAVAPDWGNATVLDLGCNQGGFLRMLSDSVGFQSAVGVDIAKDAIALAEGRKGARPISYVASTELSELDQVFDIAFSHEVIYLIDDLVDHARQLASVLKPGASYYAVTCCHSDSPLWASWRPKIQSFSNVAVPNHSIQDIVSAFRDSGFDVSVSRFLANAFIPMEPPGEYFPTDQDRLDTYTKWKVMFQMTRQEGPT